MDAFSEALGTLRVEGAAFTRMELGASWDRTVQGSAAGEPPRLACYQVLEGGCVLETPSGARVELETGAFALLARGDGHRVIAGRTGCVLVRGVLEVDATAAMQLLSVLPALVTLESTSGLQALESAILALTARAGPGSPGADAVLRRMAEALLVQALGCLVDREPWLRWQFCAGYDAIVQRCLALMYRRPEAPWTLPLLAREVHTSRSVLAERFMTVVGEPPMTHLTRWRLGMACKLLAQSAWCVARVAEAVGYQSEPAFCRAFRRHIGSTPAAWRRQHSTAPGVMREEWQLAAA